MDIIEEFRVEYWKDGANSPQQILDLGATYPTYQAAVEEGIALCIQHETITKFTVNKTFVVQR